MKDSYQKFEVASAKPEKDPNIFRQTWKWWFLVLLCLSQMGQLYNSQAIPTLQVPFEREMGMNEITYSYLVIAETMPGFVFPLIGGLLVDYFGASKSFLATNLFIVLGQSICAFAAYEKSLLIFIIGKVIFNSASEAAQLARSKIVRIWYINNDVGRALGAAVVMQTMAVIVCDLVYPNLYEFTQSLGFPFLVGVFVCVGSAFFCVKCVLMHRKLLTLEGGDAVEDEGNKKISFKVIKNFPPIIWYLLGAASLGVDAFIIVKMYLGKYLQESYKFSIGQSGAFLAFSSVLTGVATPLAGFLTDKYGRLPMFLNISVGLIQSGVFFTIVTPRCEGCYWPALPIALMSMGLGPLLIAGYSSLVRIIDEKELGIATALIPVVISAEVIVLVLIVGRVANATHDVYGYNIVFTLALIVGLSGLFIGFLTQWKDAKGDRKLSKRIGPAPSLDTTLDGGDEQPEESFRA